MGTGGHNVPIILDSYGIRKLTPIECARIQGFPASFRLTTNVPDSALYKQIGNSVTVTVVERIAEQIKQAIGSARQS
jgi:DNA (cytosine-5)-methyltransferase 1